jgi:hypothetical protein
MVPVPLLSAALDHVGQQIADSARDVLYRAYDLEAKSAALTVPEPAFRRRMWRGQSL